VEVESDETIQTEKKQKKISAALHRNFF